MVSAISGGSTAVDQLGARYRCPQRTTPGDHDGTFCPAGPRRRARRSCPWRRLKTRRCCHDAEQVGPRGCRGVTGRTAGRPCPRTPSQPAAVEGLRVAVMSLPHRLGPAGTNWRKRWRRRPVSQPQQQSVVGGEPLRRPVGRRGGAPRSTRRSGHRISLDRWGSLRQPRQAGGDCAGLAHDRMDLGAAVQVVTAQLRQERAIWVLMSPASWQQRARGSASASTAGHAVDVGSFAGGDVWKFMPKIAGVPTRWCGVGPSRRYRR